MAIIRAADRVLHTTTTTGTGSYQLGTVPNGFGAYLDDPSITSGDTVSYTVVDDLASPTNFEIGVGTLTAGSPPTISRSTIYRSTNADAPVNWPVGTKYLFASIAARNFIQKNTDGNFDFRGLKATGLGPPTISTDAVRLGDFVSGSGRLKFPNGTLMQWGGTIGTTTSAGDLQINLPTPFADASYVPIAWNGDANADPQRIYGTRTSPARTSAAFVVRAYTHAGAVNTLSISVSWIAIGTAP